MQARRRRPLLGPARRSRRRRRATDEPAGASSRPSSTACARVRVLDPACGSRQLPVRRAPGAQGPRARGHPLGLARRCSCPMQFPQVGPQAVLGIEINPYAAELARVTIWIGEIQWMLRHGFGYAPRPDPAAARQHRDPRRAPRPGRTRSTPRRPTGRRPSSSSATRRSWAASCCGASLGDDYVDALFARLRRPTSRAMADFVAYWHEKARAMVEAGRAKRVGLLATQGIRGGANRRVLERIKETRRHLPRLVRRALGPRRRHRPHQLRRLRRRLARPSGCSTAGRSPAINANLTAGVDLTQRRPPAGERWASPSWATRRAGRSTSRRTSPTRCSTRHNPDGRSNRDVVRPWVNGLDITGRPRGHVDHRLRDRTWRARRPRSTRRRSSTSASTCKPMRAHRAPAALSRTLVAARRAAIAACARRCAGLPRYIATPTLAKHRLFVWLDRRRAARPPAHRHRPRRRLHLRRAPLARPRALGACAWARSCERSSPASATRRRRRSRRSRSRDPPTSSARRSRRPPRASTSSATAGSTRPAPPRRSSSARTLTNLYNERPTWLARHPRPPRRRRPRRLRLAGRHRHRRPPRRPPRPQPRTRQRMSRDRVVDASFSPVGQPGTRGRFAVLPGDGLQPTGMSRFPRAPAGERDDWVRRSGTQRCGTAAL